LSIIQPFLSHPQPFVHYFLRFESKYHKAEGNIFTIHLIGGILENFFWDCDPEEFEKISMNKTELGEDDIVSIGFG
jgi:hypothetical protein